MRRKNLDSPERAQREKVGVARNNFRRIAAHGEFEEFVVFGITASRDSHVNFNPFGLARQSSQKTSNIFLIYVLTELFPPEDLIKLGERCKGEQDFSFSKNLLKGMTGLRIGQKQGTNQNVGIEDAAQLRAL